MIISIALRDYSDYCLKSLNCNSTQKVCSKSAADKGHPIALGKVYLLLFVLSGKDSMASRALVCIR